MDWQETHGQINQCRNAFDKFQHPKNIREENQTRYKGGIFLNIIKCTHEKIMASIVLNRKILR